MIGLIGGLGVGATVHYYRAIVDEHARLGLTPRLMIAHADASRVLASIRDGKLAELVEYLAGFADNLAAGGASFGAIAAVAPHICFGELTNATCLPMISMVTEAAREIASRSLHRVALFGTRFVVESDFYGQLGDLDIVRPTPDEIDQIHDTYIDVVIQGRGTPDHREVLGNIARKLMVRERVEAIVLAGTELALVFRGGNADFPVVDCAAAHIDGILRQVVDPPRNSGSSGEG
jgi:aspartate racemase